MSKAVTARPINPLLARYLTSLSTRPLYTKAVTAGVLALLQEILANHIAKVPFKAPKSASIPEKLAARAKIDSRALKLGLYGFFISAPMGHYLVGGLQKAFEGKDSPLAKLSMLLANNVFIAPIQTVVYLASMAVINGARSADGILAVVKGGLMKVLRVTWVVSPLAVIIAQKYLPAELWVVFFNLVGFALGTTFNVLLKKAQLKKIAESGKGKDVPKEK